jgi:maleate isomerase
VTAASAPVIDYGARLRAGILIPSGNSVAEPELRAMQVEGISLLVTRLSLRGSSKPELMRMLDRLEAASELLADAQVGCIV